MIFTKLARNTSLGPCLTILAQIRSSVNPGDLSTRSSSPGLVKISHLIKDKLACENRTEQEDEVHPCGQWNTKVWHLATRRNRFSHREGALL